MSNIVSHSFPPDGHDAGSAYEVSFTSEKHGGSTSVCACVLGWYRSDGIVTLCAEVSLHNRAGIGCGGACEVPAEFRVITGWESA